MKNIKPLSKHPDLFVLVVDDGPNMRRLIRDMLAQIGLTRVRCEVGCEEVLKQFPQIAPDLLIMSWELTRIRPEALARLALNPGRTGRIPVIALLDQATRAQVLRARSAGALAVLQKPISPSVLRDRITWVMERFLIDPNVSGGSTPRLYSRGLARAGNA
jgi:CheY-like chemotaxis protein